MTDAEIILWFFGLWFLGMAIAVGAYVAHSRRKKWVRPPTTPATTPSTPPRRHP